MKDVLKIVMEGLDGVIRISPDLYLGGEVIDPSDLSRIAATGTGIYGLQEHHYNPFKEAPIHEEVGGHLYFANTIKQKDLFTLCKVLKMNRLFGHYGRKYAVFLSASKDPVNDGYLVQMRLVSRFGLLYYFHVITDNEYEKFPDQLLTMPELCWEFVQQQNQMWGTEMGNERLEGLFGGDDYWELEMLSYGMMVESTYHNIYRIWSRCWLVTK